MVPKHTIKTVMTLLFTAERQVVKSQCEAPTFLVINQSTTIPMPTEMEWKEQSLLDLDLAYLIQKIKANEVVSYITLLDNKGYYKQWMVSKLEVENDYKHQATEESHCSCQSMSTDLQCISCYSIGRTG
jgi:hypothetical protein